MIDQITEIDPYHIKALKSFNNARVCYAIESCAQLGAYHVRFLLDFNRHAFLIKVKEYEIWPEKQLCGQFFLSGACLSRSNDAFLYKIQFYNQSNLCICGQFLFGVADYDENFERNQLKQYYKEMFARLVCT